MKKHPHLFFGSAWKAPVELYSPLRHDAALLTADQDNTTAITLLKYLKFDKANAIINSLQL